jgi:hypothetical protein
MDWAAVDAPAPAGSASASTMLEEDASVHSVAAGGVASSTVSVASNRTASGTGAGLGQQGQGRSPCDITLTCLNLH